MKSKHRKKERQKNRSLLGAGMRMLLPLSILYAGVLSACGRGTNELPADDAEYEALLGDSAERKESDGIPGRLSFEADANGTWKLVVDAEVFGELGEGAGIYEQTVEPWDDALMQRLGSSLFDAGSFKIQKPYALCTKEELDEEKAFFDELESREYDENKNAGFQKEFERYYVEYNLAAGNHSAEAERELLDGEIIVFSEGGRSAQGTLRGSYDEKPYELLYRLDTAQGSERLYFQRLGRNTKLSASCDVTKEKAEYELGENPCDFDSARLEAERFMEKLNLSEYEPVRTDIRICIREEAQGSVSRACGYRFFYVPVRGGIANAFCENDAHVSVKGEAADGSAAATRQERIVIDVDEAGIVCAEFGGIYQTLGALAENPGCIAFDKLKELVRSEVQKTEISTSYREITIDRIRLANVTVAYENRFASVPVWLLIEKTDEIYGGWPYERVWRGINALDGTVIYFEDERMN